MLIFHLRDVIIENWVRFKKINFEIMHREKFKNSLLILLPSLSHRQVCFDFLRRSATVDALSVAITAC